MRRFYYYVGTPATEREKAQKKRKEGHTGKLLSGSCPQAVVGSSRVQTAVGANEKSQKEIEVDDSSAASDKEDMLASNDADKTERPAKHSKNEPALSPGPIEITTYVDIISPPHTLKAKETSMTQGPFFFNTQTTQLDFLGLLAVCAVDPGFSLGCCNNQPITAFLENSFRQPTTRKSLFQASRATGNCSTR